MFRVDPAEIPKFWNLSIRNEAITGVKQIYFTAYPGFLQRRSELLTHAALGANVLANQQMPGRARRV